MADEKKRLARIATVTGELDQALDRLYANVAELKNLLLTPPEPENTTEEP